MSSKGLSIFNPDHPDNNQLHVGRYSSPIMTLTPGYGKGKTPLWNTFESMEIDFDIDDLSDEEDEDELNTTMLGDYDNYSINDSDFYAAQQQQNLATFDEKQKAVLSTPKKSTARSSVPPSAMLNIGSNSTTNMPKNENEKPSLKQTVSAMSSMSSSKESKPATRARGHSMPMRNLKHYQISGLTIWSNHRTDLEELYMKEQLAKDRKKVRKSKQIKFKNMDATDDDSKSVEVNEEQHVRRYLIGEIIETEETYVKGLNTLLYEFVIPMLDQKLVKAKYKDAITCNIPEILLFHSGFLQQLVSATEVDFDNKTAKSVASVFVELCNDTFVEMYTKYIKEYHNMLDIYAKYNKVKKLQKYLKNKRKERKPLTNHLILPIQRVTRYLLLLTELKNKTSAMHSDYKELETVIGKIVQTCNMINERQREIENMSQCLQVQETMNGLNRNIVEAKRKLLAQFLFRKKQKQRARQFFLFNDLLIITNLKLKVKCIILMRTIEVKNSSATEFRLYAPNHECMYETDADKFQDLCDFRNIIEDNRKLIHKESLRSLGANEMATMLNKHSVSQGNLFRKQVRDNVSLTSKLSNASNSSISDDL